MAAADEHLPTPAPTPARRSAVRDDAAFEAVLLSGAGNRFVLLDARDRPRPNDPPALARRLATEGIDGFRPDGLLLVGAPRGAGHLALEVYNADGSQPEACGNGLRCVGLFLARRRHTGRLRVETAAGTRELSVGGTHDTPRVFAGLGRARILARDQRLDVGGTSLRATLVDVGNPHCVLSVACLEDADVERLGPLIERHPRFPARTNVEWVERVERDSGPRPLLRARVWERGVGETAACGTGAGASAYALFADRPASWPVRVALPGGELEVSRRGEELSLTGPLEWVGERAVRAAAAAD